MVVIRLNNVGKQFNSDWIFSGITIDLSPEKPTAILGSNGSGKSTLLQVILSAITPTIGQVTYLQDGISLNIENSFRLMSVSAPYIELIEEFTLKEIITFHSRMKPVIRNHSLEEIIDICKLQKNINKPIKNFSSGMKQRVKLALAVLSDTPVLLLDEPTSNLDQAGIDWYMQLVSNYKENRTIIVSSNSLSHEYSFCNQIINLEDYKLIPNTDASLLLF